jgi:hypothetical protein
MVKHESDYNYTRAGSSRRYSDWAAPAIVLVSALGLYMRTMAPSVFWDDSAAFSTCNYILGLPHSPSFPLYTLLGRLFVLIPTVTPAFASNLMSAIFASLAVMFFFLLVRYFIDVPVFQAGLYKQMLAQKRQQEEHPELKRQVNAVNFMPAAQPVHVLLPSVAVTALFAVSLPLWLSAVRAEVYSLHLFLTLAAVYLCVRGVKEINQKSYLLGLWCYALSFANHPLLALGFAPAFLYLAVLNLARVDRVVATLSATALLFIAAFSVYFYLPFRSAWEPSINWGRPDNPASFWAALTRASDFKVISEMTRAADYILRIKKIGFFVSGQIGWPLIILALPGLFGLWKISRKLFLFFPLALICNLAIVLWAADFDYRNYDLVNYLAPFVAVILLCGVAGMLYIMRMKMPTGHVSVLMTVLIGAFIYVAAPGNYNKADMSKVHGPDIISQAILKNVPRGSVIMVAEDGLLLPLWYSAYADSTADSLYILSPGAMHNRAYRQQLTVNYPDLNYPSDFTDDRPVSPDSLAIQLCRLNAQKRSIYVQFGVPGIGYNELVPDGILYRYVGSEQSRDNTGEDHLKHLVVVQQMLAGNPAEARTVEFCGQWLFTQGVYYERAGKGEIAWELFKRALDVDRESIDMRIRLASALALAGNYKAALQYIAQALEIDSQDPHALELGQSIIRAMNAKEAVASK